MKQEQFETIVGLLVEIRDSLAIKAEPNAFGQWADRWTKKSEESEEIDATDMFSQLDAAKEKLALLGELLTSFETNIPKTQSDEDDEE